MPYHFGNTTLLITHYNRSSSLEHLLRSFDSVGVVFGDIVVSDDGSGEEHLSKLRSLTKEFPFRLITTVKNRGLGNNINKGQDAVQTPYTLYVQEDFEPANDFGVHFTDALYFMEQRADLDMVRFYAYFKYPYLNNPEKGFAEMVFRLGYPGYKKFYYYSDHPHLRRSSFLEKFGRYTEGVKGDVMEYRMMLSFLQHKGKALFYLDFRNLFFQKNSAEEPSTMKRDFWRNSNNFAVHLTRELYRHLKFNADYLFRKF
jgi:glycosyltransferase involved in cell wall biosynthesis